MPCRLDALNRQIFMQVHMLTGVLVDKKKETLWTQPTEFLFDTLDRSRIGVGVGVKLGCITHLG